MKTFAGHNVKYSDPLKLSDHKSLFFAYDSEYRKVVMNSLGSFLLFCGMPLTALVVGGFVIFAGLPLFMILIPIIAELYIILEKTITLFIASQLKKNKPLSPKLSFKLEKEAQEELSQAKKESHLTATRQWTKELLKATTNTMTLEDALLEIHKTLTHRYVVETDKIFYKLREKTRNSPMTDDYSYSIGRSWDNPTEYNNKLGYRVLCMRNMSSYEYRDLNLDWSYRHLDDYLLGRYYDESQGKQKLNSLLDSYSGSLLKTYWETIK